jgi:hypothetical protein
MNWTRTTLHALLLAALILAVSASAEEGMWPMYDLDKLDFELLQALGLQLTPDQIYNERGTGIAGAVLNVGGGSGSFVSPYGLIVTNHHVAYGGIQRQSTVDKNYLEKGFYARTRQDELPAIGVNVYVLRSIGDVTDRIKRQLTDRMSDLERTETIDRISSEIIDEAESEGNVRCEVAATFGGAQYMLHTYFWIRDVRIVYAPPESIGNFGGEIDNWQWPRHTGDFAFLRAYVAPDGSSAPYAKENVPFEPKTYLHISKTGIREGDLTLLIGYPGSTHRYEPSSALRYMVDTYYPESIRLSEDILDIFDVAGQEDSVIALRLASSVRGLSNRLKNSYGMLDGFARADIVSRREEREKKLMDFFESKPGLMDEYGHVLEDFDSLYARREQNFKRDQVLKWLARTDLLGPAVTIHRWLIERQKPDLEREPGYQDRDSTRRIERLKHAQINLVPSVDRELLGYLILQARELSASHRISVLDEWFGDAGTRKLIETLDRLYDETTMDVTERRLEYFHMSLDEFEQVADPFIQLAISLRPEFDRLDQRDEEFRGARNRLLPKLIQANREWRGADMYPDANRTMRLSYGTVKGYSPRDAVRYFYLTSLSGVMEKKSSEAPFRVPPNLEGAFIAGDFAGYADPVIKDIPVNFLTTNDGTGGNSGSPVVNGKGQLVGLDFDTNYESVAKDYLYDYKMSRSIVVDMRYVLFIVDKVYNIDKLMQELTIEP